MTETNNHQLTEIGRYKAVFLHNLFIQIGTHLESISYGFFFVL